MTNINGPTNDKSIFLLDSKLPFPVITINIAIIPISNIPIKNPLKYSYNVLLLSLNPIDAILLFSLYLTIKK